MGVRLARFLAIALVMAVLGGMLLSGRARKLERQLTVPPIDEGPPGPPDSARAVALALHAYRVDHAARGEVAGVALVASFAEDSAGFLIVLAPAAPPRGVRAQVRVQRTGEVELRRIAP
jgi:GTPase